MSSSDRPDPSPEEMARRTAFARWLQQEIDLRHWDRAELAARLGTYKSTVSKWMLGNRSVTFPYALELSEVLGVSLDTVLLAAGLVDRPQRPSKVKSDLVAIIMALPDDVLRSEIPKFRALMNEHVQDEIRSSLQDANRTEQSGREPVLASA